MLKHRYNILVIISLVLWIPTLIYIILYNSNFSYGQRKLNIEDFRDSKVRFNVTHSVTYKDEPERRQVLAEDTKVISDTAKVLEENGEEIVRNGETIAILVLSCNRVTIDRCLERLIKFRPSKERFPIIVSQDCGDQATMYVIKTFDNELLYSMRQPDQSEVDAPWGLFLGYYKIARHYKWALDKMFNYFNFETVVVVEDDLDVASDFYDYFASTLPVLKADQTLWCVSAWNDNGKIDRVDRNASDLLYRTDFFPGLGWMLRSSLWAELRDKWPRTQWDDWMRSPEQRRNRSCIRPELSRTRTFGKSGVSSGMYYEEHLKYIFLNEQFVGFAEKDLSYLTKETYDASFLAMVYDSPIVSVEELQTDWTSMEAPVRMLYDNKSSLQEITRTFNLMDDFFSDIPRTAYLGVISFFYNEKRVFITPSYPWNGYVPT